MTETINEAKVHRLNLPNSQALTLDGVLQELEQCALQDTNTKKPAFLMGFGIKYLP